MCHQGIQWATMALPLRHPLLSPRPCRLAARLETAGAEGDSLAGHNLAMVAANLFSCGALRADLLYSLLNRLKAR